MKVYTQQAAATKVLSSRFRRWSTAQIVANASTFGWNLPALEKQKLFFLDARLSPGVVKAGDFDLAGMLALLEAKANSRRQTHRLRRHDPAMELLQKPFSANALKRRIREVLGGK